jgi:hypothetical protein
MKAARLPPPFSWRPLGPAAAAVLLAIPVLALADGLFFQATGASHDVGVLAQRAALWQRDDALDLTIEPRFTWEGDGAWVVPLPALPEVALGDAVFLSELDRLTAPLTLKFCTKPSCQGCMALPAAGDGRATGADTSVQMWMSGTVGTLDYVVLSASEGQDAAEWLVSRGFGLPPTAAEALASLAAEGTYFFAAKLGAQADPAASLAPVRFRFAPSVAPFYPLRLTGSGIADGKLDVLLWLVSRSDNGTALSIKGAGSQPSADGWTLVYGGWPKHDLQGMTVECTHWGMPADVHVEPRDLGFNRKWQSDLTREVIDSGWFVTRLSASLPGVLLGSDASPVPISLANAEARTVDCIDEGTCPYSACPPCLDLLPDPAPTDAVTTDAYGVRTDGGSTVGGCASAPSGNSLALAFLSLLLAMAARRPWPTRGYRNHEHESPPARTSRPTGPPNPGLQLTTPFRHDN